eukprot:CAMPEP_0182802192 /NCGR_PEP_ID=MMETSP0006_2-20121128/3354_1 /TAXON_ID=97485 /ORGANISM="Prymnesium parvum, Strain Texoma1" /LENGTH=196 /DNA_ID=CAMNT_0024927563 /DNA_START=129 /DNA_END=719 /DNA_ORIENTATION=+
MYAGALVKLAPPRPLARVADNHILEHNILHWLVRVAVNNSWTLFRRANVHISKCDVRPMQAAGGWRALRERKLGPKERAGMRRVCFLGRAYPDGHLSRAVHLDPIVENVCDLRGSLRVVVVLAFHVDAFKGVLHLHSAECDVADAVVVDGGAHGAHSQPQSTRVHVFDEYVLCAACVSAQSTHRLDSEAIVLIPDG